LLKILAEDNENWRNFKTAIAPHPTTDAAAASDTKQAGVTE